MQRAERKDIEKRQKVVTHAKSLKSATTDARLSRDSAGHVGGRPRLLRGRRNGTARHPTWKGPKRGWAPRRVRGGVLPAQYRVRSSRGRARTADAGCSGVARAFFCLVAQLLQWRVNRRASGDIYEGSKY